MVDPGRDEIVALAKWYIVNGSYRYCRYSIELIVASNSTSGTPLSGPEFDVLTECWRKEIKYMKDAKDFPRQVVNDNLKQHFVNKVSKSIKGITDDYTEIINGCLLLNNSEDTATSYKLFKGFVLLERADVTPEIEKATVVRHGLQILDEATKWASENLNPCDALSLSIQNTLTVFHNKHLNDEMKAYNIARKAYDEGMCAKMQFFEGMEQNQGVVESSLRELAELKRFLDSIDEHGN